MDYLKACRFGIFKKLEKYLSNVKCLLLHAYKFYNEKYSASSTWYPASLVYYLRPFYSLENNDFVSCIGFHYMNGTEFNQFSILKILGVLLCYYK